MAHQPGLTAARRAAHLVLGCVVSGLCLYVAFRNSNRTALLELVLHASPPYIALALGSVAANTLAKAIRWQVLLADPGKTVPLASYLRALLVGQMLNILIPARVGDVSRVYLLSDSAGSRLAIAGSIVLEKLLDLGFYLLLGMLLIVAMPVPGWLSGALSSLLIPGGLAVAGAVGLAVALRRWIGWSGADRSERSGRWSGRLQQGLVAVRALDQPATRLKAAGWTGLVWTTALLNNYLVLQALAIQAPLVTSLAVLVALQAGITLPSLPATIGVFEGLCVATLALFAIPQTVALGYGILLHVIVLLPPVLAGLVCFWLPGRRQEESS